MGDTFYRFAVLCKEFKYTLNEIAELTDSQINKILFHPRKEKTGELERPRRKAERPKPSFSLNLPDTLPVVDQRKARFGEYFESYNALFTAMQAKVISQDNFNESVAKLRAKFADLWEKVEEKVEEKLPDASTAESLATLERCRIAGLLTESEFAEAKQKLQTRTAT